MKILKMFEFKNLFLALSLIVFVSCSNEQEDITPDFENITDDSEIADFREEEADFEYTLTEGDFQQIFGKENLQEMFDAQETIDSLGAKNSPGNGNVGSPLRKIIPSWAWWLHQWEAVEGHTIAKHWNKSRQQLINRANSQGLVRTSSFSSDFLSGVQFSNMMKWIADNKRPDFTNKKIGSKITVKFSAPPGMRRSRVGYVWDTFSQRMTSTQKFKVVFKKIRESGVFEAGSIIVLTAFPIDQWLDM